MKIDIALEDGIGLQITSGTTRGSSYPTGKIQKGLTLLYQGQDLSEEAVGFGVPVIKRGLQTFFPGEVELYRHEGNSPIKFTARYKLNLEEKISRPGAGTIQHSLLYTTKNVLAAVIRRLPAVRRLLTGTSNLLRAAFGWETTYVPNGFFTYIALTYTIDTAANKLKVELLGQDTLSPGASEIILMNEQGAHFFDQYQDDDGHIQVGTQIGCWDEVESEYAAFICSQYKLSFTLPQVKGARLYHGRELIGTRLAWAGFGYSFPPVPDHFAYEMTIQKLP